MKELQDLQNRMIQLQQSAEEKVGKKRDELIKPILEKAQNAIQTVGKENGYSYIFDASGGAVVFAKDSDNVMPLVKAKLGIQ